MRSFLRACWSWAGVELNPVSFKEKIISALGGFVAMLALVLISRHALFGNALPLIASMAASAVLLFAVPHGQLSQPWPVIGGHGISALIGVCCAQWIPSPAVATATAVGASIAAMHQLKCIHPPGGATAMIAVLGGPAIREMGFAFIVYPVLSNALAMVAIAVLINGFFHWRRYPSHLVRHSLPIPGASGQPTHEEVVRALRSLDSFVDITEEDLLRLLRILGKSAPPRPPRTTTDQPRRSHAPN